MIRVKISHSTLDSKTDLRVAVIDPTQNGSSKKKIIEVELTAYKIQPGNSLDLIVDSTNILKITEE